jgi:hypothetical protein
VSHRLNLAKRPFIDTRPVNAAIALLVVATLVLAVVGYRTVQRYLTDSRRTREAIAQLRSEAERLETDKAASEQGLAAFDVAALNDSAREVQELARLANFSWTRFFTRVEKTLPADARIVRVALAREERAASAKAAAETEYKLDVTLLSRNPNGLPHAIRAFYASPYFDEPAPVSEEGPAAGSAEGWTQTLTVTYRDDVADKPDDVVPQARNPVTTAAGGVPAPGSLGAPAAATTAAAATMSVAPPGAAGAAAGAPAAARLGPPRSFGRPSTVRGSSAQRPSASGPPGGSAERPPAQKPAGPGQGERP